MLIPQLTKSLIYVVIAIKLTSEFNSLSIIYKSKAFILNFIKIFINPLESYINARFKERVTFVLCYGTSGIR